MNDIICIKAIEMGAPHSATSFMDQCGFFYFIFFLKNILLKVDELHDKRFRPSISGPYTGYHILHGTGNSISLSLSILCFALSAYAEI